MTNRIGERYNYLKISRFSSKIYGQIIMIFIRNFSGLSCRARKNTWPEKLRLIDFVAFKSPGINKTRVETVNETETRQKMKT